MVSFANGTIELEHKHPDVLTIAVRPLDVARHQQSTIHSQNRGLGIHHNV